MRGGSALVCGGITIFTCLNGQWVGKGSRFLNQVSSFQIYHIYFSRILALAHPRSSQDTPLATRSAQRSAAGGTTVNVATAPVDSPALVVSAMLILAALLGVWCALVECLC